MYNTSKKSVSEEKKNTLLDFNRRDELDDILAALNKLSEQINTINDNRITDKAQLDLLNAQIFSSPKQNNSPISTSPQMFWTTSMTLAQIFKESTKILHNVIEESLNMTLL